MPRDDPEDGITGDIDNLLSGRKNSEKVSNWNDLWHILFPNDMAVPLAREFDIECSWRSQLTRPVFEPVVEHFALERFIQDDVPRLWSWLETQVPELGSQTTPFELESKFHAYFSELFDSFRRTSDRNQPKPDELIRPRDTPSGS